MQRVNFYEREQIEYYLKLGRKKSWIARMLKKDYSVIKREIQRNSGNHFPYDAKTAQRLTDQRAKYTNKRKLEKYENKELREYVVKKLRNDWSPEQIAGRLKKSPTKETVSHEAIYDYIYNGEGKFEYLYPHLRTKRKKRRRKLGRKNRSITIKNRVSIHKRPAIVKNKKRYGDWEIDLMLFCDQREVLMTGFERKSQFCFLKKLKDKTAMGSERTIQNLIKKQPDWLFKTLTRDNGGENAEHEKTKIKFKVKSYFCDPYSSWQKGGVENLNKLVREYLPREEKIGKISKNQIRTIEAKLNNRPRKLLNYSTPYEIIAKRSARVKMGH